MNVLINKNLINHFNHEEKKRISEIFEKFMEPYQWNINSILFKKWSIFFIKNCIVINRIMLINFEIKISLPSFVWTSSRIVEYPMNSVDLSRECSVTNCVAKSNSKTNYSASLDTRLSDDGERHWEASKRAEQQQEG